MGHKSIGIKLKGARTTAGKFALACDWGNDWYNEQSALLRRLQEATNRDDRQDVSYIMRQLLAVNEKRHGALPGVLQVLADAPAMSEDTARHDREAQSRNEQIQEDDIT